MREDYLRADVKLLGNGTEIKNMLNKSSEKLTVGQTVTVAYSTLPSSGVILIANGEADPLAEGGGWDVENAVLFDEENLHDYTVDTELMTDISANTKLYYSATNRLVVAQGMLCYIGNGSDPPAGNDFTTQLDALLTANSEYLSPSYQGIVSYTYDSYSNYVTRNEADVTVYPYAIDIDSTGRTRWWFRIVSDITSTNLRTSAVTTNRYTADVNFYTTSISDITEYGLILYTNKVGAGSPRTELDTYIPYGYVGSSSIYDVKVMLVYKNNNQSIGKWNADYQGTIRSGATYTSGYAGAYVPLTSPETVFMLGATQRSEPVSAGGGN